MSSPSRSTAAARLLLDPVPPGPEDDAHQPEKKPPSVVLESGERLSHYRILDQIGHGGMGVVYSAFDESLHRHVAIKAIGPERRLDAGARARLMREARILSALDHPGVCRIFDHLQIGRVDFLILELVHGQNLREFLRHPLSRAKALDLAEQLAGVLAAAHAAGVVHRDLKPGNVMITPEGVLKVLDFGLSRRSESTDSTTFIKSCETRAQLDGQGASGQSSHVPVLGTLQYMSPEQGRGKPVGTPTDLFALGMILQELFTREPARPADLDPNTLLNQVLTGTVVVSPHLERSVAKLVRRLTAFEPSARPRAVDVLRRLQRLRSRPRCIQRRALVAGALGAAGLGLFSLQLEHAYLKGLEQSRTRQAEALLDFMLGDLSGRLEEVGEHEILNEVGLKVLEYFERVPVEGLSLLELEHACHTATDLGRMRSAQGHGNEALRFFARAQHFAQELTARDPRRPEFRAQLAAARMRLAALAHELGEEGAAQRLEEAVQSWRDLVRSEPDDPRWQAELAQAFSRMQACLAAERDPAND